MLKVSAQKLDSIYGHVAFLFLSIIEIHESNGVIVIFDDTFFGDCYPPDVSSQVLQKLRGTEKRRLAVDHPRLVPYASRKLYVRQRLFGVCHEFAPKQDGEGLDRHQIVWMAATPTASDRIISSARHDAMNMRMIDHGTTPGVQHRHDADLCADILWIPGHQHQGPACCFKQDVDQKALMGSYESAKFTGNRKHQVKVINLGKLGFASGYPMPCSSFLTRGTSSVAAGMINIVNLAASIAPVQMGSHRSRPAGGEICKRPLMSGQHTISISFQIPGSKTAHDPGNFVHDRTRCLQPGHDLVDCCMERVDTRSGQMRVDCGGRGVSVTKGLLDRYHIDAVFEQVSCI